MHLQLADNQTPTIDAVVAESATVGAMLIALLCVIWLAWRVLAAFDRELARKRCEHPQRDTPGAVFDRLTQSHTIQDTTADGSDTEAR